MKTMKKWRLLLLIIIIGITSIIILPQRISAKAYSPNKDIWDDLEGDDSLNLVHLINNNVFALGFARYADDHLRSDQVMTFDFSKVSKRRYILKWIGISGMPGDNTQSVSELSKWLFGVNTSNVPRIDGEVGGSYPSIGMWDRLNGLYQVGKNKYKYTKTLYMINEESGDSPDTLGFVEYTLKKKPGSHYGWIVKKAKVTKS